MVTMLVDYLEESSVSLRDLEQKLVKLDKDYKLFLDRDIKDQMNLVKKDIRKTWSMSVDYIYKHLQEFFLLKKHFPNFFQMLKEDQSLGKVIEKIEWLLDFKKLDHAACQQELAKLKEQRKQLRDVKDFLRKWVGRIDRKSLIATWPFLKAELKTDLDKDEVLEIIKRKNRELRRKGWLILLNEPFIFYALDRLLSKLKKFKQVEADKRTEFEKLRGRGIYAQSEVEKKLKEAARKRRKMERKCEHLLLANYEYFQKLKKQKVTWRDKTANLFLTDLVEKIDAKLIDEKRWVVEMNKKLQ